MKRLLALILGGLGLRAVLRRRNAPAPLGPSPADDLREKLAVAKATADAQVEDAEEHETSVDDRRADVHAKARRTLDELKD